MLGIIALVSYLWHCVVDGAIDDGHDGQDRTDGEPGGGFGDGADVDVERINVWFGE